MCPTLSPALAGEGEEGEVRGVEHQLDAHEDHQRVAADQHAEHAQAEEQPRQDQVVLQSGRVTCSDGSAQIRATWRPRRRRRWPPAAASDTASNGSEPLRVERAADRTPACRSSRGPRRDASARRPAGDSAMHGKSATNSPRRASHPSTRPTRDRGRRHRARRALSSMITKRNSTMMAPGVDEDLQHRDGVRRAAARRCRRGRRRSPPAPSPQLIGLRAATTPAAETTVSDREEPEEDRARSRASLQLSEVRPRAVSPNGQRVLGRMCSSNSARNFMTKLCTGSAAASPSAQMVLPSPIGG